MVIDFSQEEEAKNVQVNFFWLFLDGFYVTNVAARLKGLILDFAHVVVFDVKFQGRLARNKGKTRPIVIKMVDCLYNESFLPQEGSLHDNRSFQSTIRSLFVSPATERCVPWKKGQKTCWLEPKSYESFLFS